MVYNKGVKAIYYDQWDSSFIPEIYKFVYTNNIFQPYFYGKSNLTIVDVGAGIGIATNYFSEFGKVYSFEPCLETYKCLTEMVKFNKLDVETQQIAISDKNGEEKLYHSNNSTANSLMEAVSNGSSEIVVCRTLGDVLKPIKHVDYLWLELEGKEFDVLASPSFDEIVPKVDMIMGTISNWNNRNPGQIIQSLTDRGYKAKVNGEIFYGQK